MEYGFEEAAAFSLGRSDLCFQPIAQRHQFVHLGDDATLLRERRHKDLGCFDLFRRNVRNTIASPGIDLICEVGRVTPIKEVVSRYMLTLGLEPSNSLEQ